MADLSDSQRSAQNQGAQANQERITALESELSDLRKKYTEIEEENRRLKNTLKRHDKLESALSVFITASKDAEEILAQDTAESVSLDVMIFLI